MHKVSCCSRSLRDSIEFPQNATAGEFIYLFCAPKGACIERNPSLIENLRSIEKALRSVMKQMQASGIPEERDQRGKSQVHDAFILHLQ